jgi:hypothetical protein
MAKIMTKELTSQEFRPAVLAILDQQEEKYKDSLENHLLSLWVTIKGYEKHMPSYSLFVRMLEEAFDTQPFPFDTQWLNYENDLFWDYESGSCVIKEYRNEEWVVTANNVDDLEILKHILFFSNSGFASYESCSN